MKNISAFLILIVFIPSALLGYWAGLMFKLPQRLEAPASQLLSPKIPFTPIPTMPHGQSTILILHSDKTSTPHPQLRSIWLLTYFANTAQLNLIPIYPSTAESAASINQTIFSAFGLAKADRSLAPAPLLIQTLEEQNYRWSGYIILDDAAVQDIFALARMNAPSALSIPTSHTTPPSLYYQHVQAINNFCNATRSPNTRPDWTQIGTWSSEHFVTDLSIDALIADLQALTSQTGGLRCNFPTIIQEQQ